MALKSNIVTFSSLIQKDLDQAYFLPSYPTTYRNDYWLLNDKKFKVFDHPPPPLLYYESIYPFRNLLAVGEKVPVLLDQLPPQHLITHWKQWLSVFPLPVLKTIDEGLKDDIPIVTLQALQSIPENKQSIQPHILYKLQLKSTILDIGVPCPKHFDERDVSYPCLVKVDQSHDGEGNRVAKNEIELSKILKEIREELGWNENIIFQEMVQDIQEVPSFQFYLHKSGEMFWVGTAVGNFTPEYWTVDWNKQDYYKDLVFEEFTIPIVNYLHREGYFGFVTFELLITDHGKYLIDLNPRISADTTHMLIALYMAQQGYTQSYLNSSVKVKTTDSKVVEKANEINASTDSGKIIVMSTANEAHGCTFFSSVFARTRADVNDLCDKLINFEFHKNHST